MRQIFFLLMLIATPVSAQESLFLQERFAPNAAYQVSCRVTIHGQLPGAKESLPIKGSSTLEYDERLLADKGPRIDKSLRAYRKIEFERTIGDLAQHSTVRPEARRMVILRRNQVEVPFSPDSEMTWNELDLIRTDVFTPALQGLLPTAAVRAGQSWDATQATIQELTDLEQITQGDMKCQFKGIETPAGTRQQARIDFRGSVKGIGEDGPTQHDLQGFCYFDLAGNYLSYLYVQGKQTLADKGGQGNIIGSFTLTRTPIPLPRNLSDDSLRPGSLEPNERNTLLLYDNADLGVRFLYPRRWRVGEVKGTEIRLDEKSGSGLKILIEKLGQQPAADKFQASMYEWLGQQRAKVHQAKNVQSLQAAGLQTLQHFAFDADLSGQRAWLDFYMVRQPMGAATISARVIQADQARVQAEVSAIARSIAITRAQ